MQVKSPSIMMSSRKGACRGCDECVGGISVLGVMIYDQMFPELPLHDHVQELKSICITRTVGNLTSHPHTPTSDRHIAAFAMELIQERLPSGGKFDVNPLAYLDTPIDKGKHMQRCYLVPKSSALEDELSDHDAQQGLRRSRSCNDAAACLPQTASA